MPTKETTFRELGSLPNVSGLRGLSVPAAPSGPVGFFDDFQRADESPVAFPWEPASWTPYSQDLLNHALVAPGPGGRANVVDVSAYGLGINVVITVDFTVNSGASPDSGICLSDSSGCLLFYENYTTWGVYRLNGSGDVSATIASGGGVSALSTSNKLFVVTANGTDYTFTINGVLLWSGSYTPLTRTSTKHGWYNGRNDNTNTLNSFRVDAYP